LEGSCRFSLVGKRAMLMAWGVRRDNLDSVSHRGSKGSLVVMAKASKRIVRRGASALRHRAASGLGHESGKLLRLPGVGLHLLLGKTRRRMTMRSQPVPWHP
jgi:hypothetical protein